MYIIQGLDGVDREVSKFVYYFELWLFRALFIIGVSVSALTLYGLVLTFMQR